MLLKDFLSSSKEDNVFNSSAYDFGACLEWLV